MHNPVLDQSALDLLFYDARSYNDWLESGVSEEQIEKIYELACLGPTSVNGSPGRFYFCRSPEAREKLAACASEGNRGKILRAPLCVIVGMDMAFYEKLAQLLPYDPSRGARFASRPEVVADTAFRNSALQGAYLMMAARAIGLDCGPMSGFDKKAVDAAFFEGTSIKSNFICNIGRGDKASLKERLPRLSFAEACMVL